MKIWVAKEAILKAAGRGLSVNPRRVSLPRSLAVSETPGRRSEVFVPGLAGPFWVQILEREQVILALAQAGAKPKSTAESSRAD